MRSSLRRQPFSRGFLFQQRAICRTAKRLAVSSMTCRMLSLSQRVRPRVPPQRLVMRRAAPPPPGVREKESVNTHA